MESQLLPVAIQSCSLALPAGPTPRAKIFLPNIDLTVVFMVDSIYFYSSGAADAPKVLFRALQEVMVEFYPFAGRLAVSEETQRLEIDANSAGVPFVEAVSDLNIADLGDLTLPNALYRNLVFTATNVKVLSDWPLATVQVTKFLCGGFSFGLSVNHALADGISIIDFMQHLTSKARGVENFQLPELQFDRTMLAARPQPTPKIDFADVYYKASEIPSTNSFSTMEDMVVSTNLASGNYVVTDLVSRAINIPASKVEYLKKLAMSDGTITRCSTFDVVATYVWKLRTAAMGMPLEHQATMFMAVDVSKKVTPPIPRGFVGNRAFPVAVRMKTEELLKKPLSHCLTVVREALLRADDEFVRSWIDWSEIHRGIPKFNGGFYISSWWKFPFYEMDFGWGKPIYMGPVLTQRVEFVLILPVSPSRPEGGVDVLLTINPQHMARFETLVNFPIL
ncbi:BAHD family acyltransferase, clade V [Selaginella moellendorffii]|uniref:BAHD family acyltransferase, clade V n=1 Tax=Selaginella moellendorffii TaxID=88036 RepID=D8TAY6_SELML|nr:BAHD family acyltransferase, clade V [Selaginella moellendorffii]